MQNLKLISDTLGTELFRDDAGREYIAQLDGSLIPANHAAKALANAAPDLLKALQDLVEYTDKADAYYTSRGYGADELGREAPTESVRGRAMIAINKATTSATK